MGHCTAKLMPTAVLTLSSKRTSRMLAVKVDPDSRPYTMSVPFGLTAARSR